MCMLAVPMILLYELGILLVGRQTANPGRGGRRTDPGRDARRDRAAIGDRAHG